MNKDNIMNEKDHIEELLEEEAVNEDKAGVKTEEDTDVVSETALKNKIKELEEKLIRHAADSENYQKRLIREMDDKIKYANQSLLSKFLPVLDNFDLALQHVDGVSVETVIEGIKLNQKVMIDILSKSGLEKLDIKVGDPFNPEIHEALTLTNNPDLPDNTISLIIQNGYKLADRVIRSAKVQVNKVS